MALNLICFHFAFATNPKRTYPICGTSLTVAVMVKPIIGFEMGASAERDDRNNS